MIESSAASLAFSYSMDWSFTFWGEVVQFVVPIPYPDDLTHIVVCYHQERRVSGQGGAGRLSEDNSRGKAGAGSLLVPPLPPLLQADQTLHQRT